MTAEQKASQIVMEYWAHEGGDVRPRLEGMIAQAIREAVEAERTAIIKGLTHLAVGPNFETISNDRANGILDAIDAIRARGGEGEGIGMDDGRLDLMPRDRGTLEMLLRHARESTASLLAEEPSIKKSGKPPSPLFLRTVLEAIANEKLELAFYRKELPVFLKATATGDTPKLTVACICGRQCVTDDTA